MTFLPDRRSTSSAHTAASPTPPGGSLADLPAVEWLLTYPLGVGDGDPVRRSARFNGSPVPARQPFDRVTCVCWLSRGRMARGGRFGIPLAVQGAISMMSLHLRGSVASPRVAVVADVSAAIDLARSCTRRAGDSILDGVPALSEWSLAEGFIDGEHVVGLHYRPAEPEGDLAFRTLLTDHAGLRFVARYSRDERAMSTVDRSWAAKHTAGPWWNDLTITDANGADRVALPGQTFITDREPSAAVAALLDEP
jgi:hypothetical protein